MSIFVPPVLNELSSIPKLADALAKFADPTERKKIETDIKNLHVLNESEAKQYADAKALIKQNLDAVAEAKKITDKNAEDKAALQAERIAFSEEKRIEYQKISDAKLPANEALVRAQALKDEAKSLQDDVTSREKALKAAKEEHANSVAALEAERKSITEERKKVADYKQQVIELEQTTKAKVDAIRKFNI